METKNQNKRTIADAPEERLEITFDALLEEDLDDLVAETSAAYMLQCSQLRGCVIEDTTFPYQLVVEFLVGLNSLKNKHGDQVKISITKKQES